MQSRWFAPSIFAAALLGFLCAQYLPPEVLGLAALTALLQTAFLAALKMIIVPLIFFSLLSGVMQLRASSSIGRLGGVTVSYYLLTSAIAIALGLTVVFFIHPWTDHPPLAHVPNADVTLLQAEDGSLLGVLTGLVKMILANPVTAFVEMNILGIFTWAVLLGIAATVVLPQESTLPERLQEITDLIMTIARWILTTLPIGMFAITYQLTGKIDVTTLMALGEFAALVFATTAIHGLLVLPALAWLLTGTPPTVLLRTISQPLITAFATSSSAATLPLSMSCAEEKLGVERAKAAFVLPLGATANMDGTALFEGMAIVFLAYMFNVQLDAVSIFVVFLMTMLASAGAPGIPSGSMAGVQVVMLAVGIPLEAIALLLLIERPLDTFRTAVNVEGDLVGALVAERHA
ncbi:MAG: dicarboxylate/amino acid:cation symporter [Pseudomonadota bacterium]